LTVSISRSPIHQFAVCSLLTTSNWNRLSTNVQSVTVDNLELKSPIHQCTVCHCWQPRAENHQSTSVQSVTVDNLELKSPIHQSLPPDLQLRSPIHKCTELKVISSVLIMT
jgi:hypothetical protein